MVLWFSQVVTFSWVETVLSNEAEVSCSQEHNTGRPGGLVVERWTPEQEVGGSILTQVAVLYP